MSTDDAATLMALGRLDQKMDAAHDRLDSVESAQASTAAAVTSLNTRTADLLAAWEAAVGGLKVLAALGTFAKYCSYIAATVTAIGAAIAFWKHGK